MTNYDRVAQQIYGIITGHRHDVLMFNDEGSETVNPEEARHFFVKEPNYQITINENDRVIDVHRSEHTSIEEFETLMKQIRQTGVKFMLKTNLRVWGRQIQPKDFSRDAKIVKQKKIEDVLESSLSSMYGSKKTSYQALEGVKLVVKHYKPVSEEVRGSRSRSIKNIFIECEGERIEFPYKNLGAARAMARHYYKGGVMEDEVGQHILGITEEMVKLRDFVHAVKKNNLINEENGEAVEVAHQQYESIRHTLKRLSGVKTYDEVREQLEAELQEERIEEADGDLVDMFTVKKVDRSVEEALPVVTRLMKVREQYKNGLLDESQNPFVIRRAVDLEEDEVFEYTDPQKRMGYNLSRVLNRVVEESELTRYLQKVSNNLLEGNQITDFDRTLIRNVLKNVQLGN